MRKFISKIGGKYILWGIVVLVYISTFFLDREKFFNSVNGFYKILISVLPILIMVFVIMFFVNLIIDSRRILKKFNETHGIIRYLFFAILGIISAGPIYMWYPLLSDLKEKGLKESLISIFLYNRGVKIPLIPIMIYYFDIKYVVILTIMIVIFSFINGLFMDLLLTNNTNENCSCSTKK